MEYFLFLSILYILPLFTEQYLVVLKPDKNDEKSHEILQMDPDARLHSAAKSKLIESKIALQSSEEEEIRKDTDPAEYEKLKESKNTEEVPEKEKEESNPRPKADNQEGMVFLLQVPSKFQGKMPLKFNDNDKKTHWKRWLSEIAAGDNSEISGTNPRIYQPDEYPFSGKFVPEHRNSEISKLRWPKVWISGGFRWSS